MTNRHLFEISAAEFASTVNGAIASLPGRPSPPIMGAVVFDLSGDKLSLSTFDWNRATTATIAVSEPGDSARLAVSGRLLAQVAKVMPRKPVQASLTAGELVLVVGRTEFKLPLMDVDDFPNLPPTPPAIGSAPVVGMLKRVATVAQQKEEDAQSVKGCVHLTWDGAHVVATAVDGFILGSATVAASGDEFAGLDVLLRASELSALLAPLDEDLVTLHYGGESTMFGLSTETGVVSTLATFDGQFFDWRKMLFEPMATTTIGAEFTAALRRAKAIANDPLTALTLDFADGEVTLSDGETIVDAVDVELDGDPVTVRLNPLRVLTVLAASGADEVELGLFANSSGMSRVKITADGFVGLVMGVRI